MPVKNADLQSGRINLNNYAIRHGSLHTLCEPDPQNAPDFDLDPPVQRPEKNA